MNLSDSIIFLVSRDLFWVDRYRKKYFINISRKHKRRIAHSNPWPDDITMYQVVFEGGYSAPFVGTLIFVERIRCEGISLILLYYACPQRIAFPLRRNRTCERTRANPPESMSLRSRVNGFKVNPAAWINGSKTIVGNRNDCRNRD